MFAHFCLNNFFPIFLVYGLSCVHKVYMKGLRIVCDFVREIKKTYFSVVRFKEKSRPCWQRWSWFHGISLAFWCLWISDCESDGAIYEGERRRRRRNFIFALGIFYHSVPSTSFRLKHFSISLWPFMNITIRISNDPFNEFSFFLITDSVLRGRLHHG